MKKISVGDVCTPPNFIGLSSLKQRQNSGIIVIGILGPVWLKVRVKVKGIMKAWFIAEVGFRV